MIPRVKSRKSDAGLLVRKISDLGTRQKHEQGKHFLPHHLQNSQGGFFMKGNYQHIFTPLTVKNMTIKKPYHYDADGHQLW